MELFAILGWLGRICAIFSLIFAEVVTTNYPHANVQMFKFPQNKVSTMYKKLQNKNPNKIVRQNATVATLGKVLGWGGTLGSFTLLHLTMFKVLQKFCKPTLCLVKLLVSVQNWSLIGHWLLFRQSQPSQVLKLR